MKNKTLFAVSAAILLLTFAAGTIAYKRGELNRVARIAEHNRPPLVRTGRLAESIRARVEDSKIVFSSDAPYAAHHQYGTRHIPARPFLVISEEPRRALARAVIEWMIQGDSNDVQP